MRPTGSTPHARGKRSSRMENPGRSRAQPRMRGENYATLAQLGNDGRLNPACAGKTLADLGANQVETHSTVNFKVWLGQHTHVPAPGAPRRGRRVGAGGDVIRSCRRGRERVDNVPDNLVVDTVPSAGGRTTRGETTGAGNAVDVGVDRDVNVGLDTAVDESVSGFARELEKGKPRGERGADPASSYWNNPAGTGKPCGTVVVSCGKGTNPAHAGKPCRTVVVSRGQGTNPTGAGDSGLTTPAFSRPR